VVKQRILAASSPGAIILSHDIHSATVRAMPGTFDGLMARGLEFRPLSQMLGWPLWQRQRFHRLASGRLAPNRALNLIALQ
jgi:hypothetical protein